VFRTLRSRLIASYVSLVVLTLLLSALVSGLLITRAQRWVNFTRTQRLAYLVAQWIENQNPPPNRTRSLLERFEKEGDHFGAQILLLSPTGQILLDNSDLYTGQSIPLPPKRPLFPKAPSNVRRYRFPDGQEYFLVYQEIGTLPLRNRVRYIVVALRIAEANPPWRDLAASMVWMGSAILLVAIGIAVFLARSITRPVSAMTKAAEAIANGHYDHEIHVEGKDEIARLAKAFTHMSRQVARTQRAQRDFLANVSHDLKTPLTSIQGFSQAILEGAITEPEGYKRAAQIIYDEAERMSRLVADLLELTRLEERELELAAEDIDLVSLIKSEIHKLEPLAQQRNLKVAFQKPPSLPGIVGDRARLTQILANLLDNAVKYATQGTTIHITIQHICPQDPLPDPLMVRFGQPADNGEWAVITITNQSSPLSQEELGRIFERFYRGDRSRQRGEGSGLGLAIAREAVLAHGGIIEASSDAERGVRFRVWLPIRPRSKR